MRFEDLEKVVRKAQVMSNRADVSFESIELEKDESIGYMGLWVSIDKEFSRDDYITMYIHISRFVGDEITVRMKISKIVDYKGTTIYEKMMEIDTISATCNFVECAIQAFIA